MCIVMCMVLALRPVFRFLTTSRCVMMVQLVSCAHVTDVAPAGGLQLEAVMPTTGCLREMQLTLRHIIEITGEDCVASHAQGSIAAAGL